MSILTAALLALAAALVELSAGPHFGIADAHPHLVLVLGVIATRTIGPQIGLAWAFVGGIAIDVLAGRPLGVTAFALTIVIGAAGLVAPSAVRVRLPAAIALVPICSAVSSALLVAALAILGTPIATADLGSFLAAMAYDTAVAIVVVPLVILAVDRRSRAGRIYA
jgi:rod shape-determining protein MreD